MFHWQNFSCWTSYIYILNAWWINWNRLWLHQVQCVMKSLLSNLPLLFITHKFTFAHLHMICAQILDSTTIIVAQQSKRVSFLCIHVCTHMRIHTHTHTQTHADTQTYIHTHLKHFLKHAMQQKHDNLPVTSSFI